MKPYIVETVNRHAVRIGMVHVEDPAARSRRQLSCLRALVNSREQRLLPILEDMPAQTAAELETLLILAEEGIPESAEAPSALSPYPHVLVIVASADPEDEGEISLRQVVAGTSDEAAADRARRIAGEQVRKDCRLTPEDDPLDAGLLEELRLSVTFHEVEVI